MKMRQFRPGRVDLPVVPPGFSDAVADATASDVNRTRTMERERVADA